MFHKYIDFTFLTFIIRLEKEYIYIYIFKSLYLMYFKLIFHLFFKLVYSCFFKFGYYNLTKTYVIIDRKYLLKNDIGLYRIPIYYMFLEFALMD